MVESVYDHIIFSGYSGSKMGRVCHAFANPSILYDKVLNTTMLEELNIKETGHAVMKSMLYRTGFTALGW
jgi:hypothetical protein